ncbi:hypothetical protein HYH02_006010 [Chlamydomonas schloesseri]|uniref:EGF-like domain-containing protein n=1 Tax=Chlamydomonas schloesseri TaxID=2026947 RepID=A0A835WJX8_9CHLO|nr:hypothetical protein HYH02_006010 [Chlamydomonas schloesseri]|eukprot:KAG2448653.1 hypothetical protein HYH02_006010 [Chlamydomonas schloesseri]
MLEEDGAAEQGSSSDDGGESDSDAEEGTSIADTAAARVVNSTCAPGCSEHGVCNEELGRCDCPRHFVGPDCQTPNPEISDVCAKYGFTLSQCRSPSPCFNSCNGRGRCVAGICHCLPGFWGMDCALSRGADGGVQLLEGQGYVPRKDSIKVYVYELPPNVTSWFNIKRLDRPLHMLFWQRLMSAGLRTVNGDEADYYFIPLNTRTLMAPEQAAWVLPYIRKTWPFWDRDQGHRHLIIHTGDLGLHELPLVMRRQMNETLSNITWLTHWGIHTYHPIGTWFPAHRPGKDIVIPVMITTPGFQLSPLNPAVAAKAAKRGRPYKREQTFFFAGRICGDRKPPDPITHECAPKRTDYSAGVRQRVYFHHHNRTGYKVLTGTSKYMQEITSHKFCLAPTGGGHGKRQVLVALMGCIPVTITDGVYQPFEPELPWADFSVPVPEADIPRLHEILEDLPPSQVEQMQSRLHCAAQHMFYSSSLGAIIGEDGRYDAFETIIEILRVRKAHPDTPPEQYVEVDERFRKFANCELGGPDPKTLCAQGTDRQHPDMPTCAECHRQVSARRSGSSFFSWAGGLVCCSELDLAKCPRVWE